MVNRISKFESVIGNVLLCMGIILSLSFCSKANSQKAAKNDASPSSNTVKESFEKKMNRLSKEQSPYLLQHKDNPVHWYPWGDAAFEAAQKEDKPIFLSIGYATCHWCHVMAHESFEDDDVAAVLNRDFISIKVDREERPDVDHIYMSVVQIMTGNGGWPLSILMTPDKKPFFAATYIPKESRFGTTGFMELLQAVNLKWRNQRKALTHTSDEVTGVLQRINRSSKVAAPDPALLDDAYSGLATAYDSEYGGFSRGTKFPTPHNLLFLLRYYQRTGAAQALQMVENTLKNMRAGGIFDHLGYGFHRYSTDDKWLVPHFEKMLYDQAMLMLAYTEAFEVTRNPLYSKVVDEIATYLTARMLSPEGAFYSAEDADSEGVEGKYYVWSRSEIEKVLSRDEAAVFDRTFQIKNDGNYQSHQTPPNTNIPYVTVDALDTWSADYASDEGLVAAKKKLLNQREKRVPPLLDDKVLTDWNGLMTAALAKAGRVLKSERYIEISEKAAQFIKTKMSTSNYTLWHRYRNGDAGIEGKLDDYAFLIFGLIELYQSTFDTQYLSWATELEKTSRELFSAEDGSYYLATDDATDLIVRPKEFYDGALPSGNSVMFDNLIRLARLLGNTDLEKDADRLAGAVFNSANRAPQSHTHFLLGLMFAMGPSVEIVIVGEKDDSQTEKLLSAASSDYFPNRVCLLKSKANAAALATLAPYTKDQVLIGNVPTAYVCTGNHCKAPTGNGAKVTDNIRSIVVK